MAHYLLLRQIKRPRRKRPARAPCGELAPKAQPPRKRSGPRTARGWHSGKRFSTS